LPAPPTCCAAHLDKIEHRYIFAVSEMRRPAAVTEIGTGPESLADQAYAKIKASIVSCRLAPGERITERVLAERFGFGLSPIRKALLRLDSEGLVSTRPRSGYRVAPLTVEDVDNLFDAWSVLGSAIIRRAAERCTTQDREDLARTVRALRREQSRAQTNTPDAAAEIGRTIWQAYCRFAGNARLTEMWESLDADLRRVFVIGGWEDPDGATHFREVLADDPLQRVQDVDAWVDEFLMYTGRVHQHVLDTLQRSESLRSHEIVLDDMASE
jgi:DNA-binding GntR family transcriptional regulator